MLALLLALLWLPASAHCLLLETASTSEIFACCTHEEPADDHRNECASDACSVVEKAQYKSSIQRIAFPPPSAQIAFELPLLLDDASPLVLSGSRQFDANLSPLPVTWQFLLRTALSPRAPSLAS